MTATASSTNLRWCTSFATPVPLHYTLFKQVLSHVPHEANTEQLFSLAGGLSDDNSEMDPYRFSIWVSIASNHKVFRPCVKEILERYMAKFSKGGKVDLADDAGLDLTEMPTILGVATE